MHRIWNIAMMLMLFVTAACAGMETEPATPARPPAPLSPEVARLRLVIMPSGKPQIDDALRGALLAAGFIVETGRDGDVVVQAATSSNAEQQFFTSNVNGVSNQRFTVSVRAVMSGPGGAIDQATAEFTSVGGKVTDQNLAPIASAFTRSAKLVTFASSKAAGEEKREQAKQAGEEKREAAKKARADRARQPEDDKAWIAARPIVCREPRRIEACDGVQKYLADYPDGRHADEAKTALEEGTPKLEKIQKDEKAWASAGVETCRRDHTKTACAGVEIYQAKFPGGLHIDEANGLMDGL